MEVARIIREHSIGSGTSICSGFDKRVEQDVRNKDKVVSGIPSTNRWANGTYESGVGQDVRNKDKVVGGIPSTNRWANGTYESGVGAVFKVFCGE